jgi:PAS domain S-box-containing protein
VAGDLAPVDLREIMRRVRFPAWIIAPDGRVVWLNEAAERLFGDVRGKPYTSLVANEYLPLAQAQFMRKLLGELVTDYELELNAADGSRVPVEVSSVPVQSPENGVPVAIFGVAHPEDIRREPVPDAPHLTPRQAEVLRHLAVGASTDQIARELSISVETVRNHIRAVLRKLGARSRLEAVARARRQGLIS